MRPWMAPALAAIPGLLLSGCGSAVEVDSEQLAEAANRTRAANTSRVDIRSEDSSGTGQGEIDYAKRRARFSFEAIEEDEPLSGEVIVVGTRLYFRSDPPLSESSKPWLQIDRGDEPPSLDELLFPFPFGDPTDALKYLGDAESSVEELGAGTSRGVEITGYRVTVDLSRAIERAPEQHRDELRRELADSKAKTRSLEVWIDEEGLLRRLRVRDSRELVTLDFYDFGADVDIEPPPADQVGTIEESMGIPRTTLDPDEQPSARFVRSDSLLEEQTTGSFDWRTRTGSARITAPGMTREIVQIGDDCYRREGRGEWRHSELPSAHFDEVCDFAFENPATADDLLKFVAGSNEVGEENIRGVPTTHYRGSLNIGAVKGAIEYWVDADGNTRRTVQTTGKDETVHEWFDFGVELHVERPVVKGKG